jgi:hypothetical protein
MGEKKFLRSILIANDHRVYDTGRPVAIGKGQKMAK